MAFVSPASFRWAGDVFAAAEGPVSTTALRDRPNTLSITNSALRDALGRLHDGRAEFFGQTDIRFTVLRVMERESATVVKVEVSGADRIPTIFVKVFKPKEAGADGRELMRARVVRDFELTSRIHAALSRSVRFAAVEPLACFPELLAVVTVEAPGQPLLDMLEQRAAWWPSANTVSELGSILSEVGGWLRAFQAVEATNGRFSLEAMREYIDVRLRRLLATDPPALDSNGRHRVLRYFDRTAAEVDEGDLGEVLTHSDLAPSNVLVSGRKVAVIDFATVTTGGEFMDVARLFTQLEFLTAKPKFRRAVVRQLQRCLLRGFNPRLGPERPLFRLFVLQHLLCHMSNIARNPAPLLARLYNRHQLRLRQRWLRTFAA